MGDSIENILILSATILGISYTIIQVYTLVISVTPKMEVFITAENKSKLRLSKLIIYLLSFLGILFYDSEYNSVSSNVEKNVYFIFLLYFIVFIIIYSVALLIKFKYNAYYILNGRLFKLNLIEDDLVFLVSMDSNQELNIQKKEILFTNKHIILNKQEFKKYKIKHMYLFEDKEL
ncbi:hypothetical protein HBP63_11880 [Listeria welshimeri]|uniref:hypothetical protein n=1 Tax=Listeria welshimeri TaxID=1643 RepID=UPI00162441D9|nr:hypothetical protein [Listeria welshimeri]MBC1861632.1 hypothetical protein [Listeria welshimeri]MBC2096837.1 hypothetical protein [Listeria welshimeri]MBC2355116.1 hypothetical protein [Listeria welshimeri]MBC6158517.1 hypothetical protein [Listeria welshimeri]MBF2465385.1 hypothetical protein [Listeria welshimeri]